MLRFAVVFALMATSANAADCRYITGLGYILTISDDGYLRVERDNARLRDCVTAPLDETTSVVACSGDLDEYRYNTAGDMELWGDIWFRHCD